MAVAYLGAPAPRLHRLTATSSHAGACGFEMTLRSSTPGPFIQAIEWLGGHWPEAGRFVMMRMPAAMTGSQVLSAIDAARGLDGILCLVASIGDLPDSASMDQLAGAGVMTVLDGVGRGTRFGDMLDMPLNGIRFETGVVEASFGDPALGSMVEAALHLARNLGLTTFARLSSAAARADHYADLIDYTSIPEIEPRTAGRAKRHGMSLVPTLPPP